MPSFQVVLPQSKPIYCVGDTIAGVVLRHATRNETVTSAQITFSGNITITDDKNGKTICRSTLFEQKQSLITKDCEIINGAWSWPFRFLFPALPPATPVTTEESGEVEGLEFSTAPYVLPPTLGGSFTGPKGHRCNFEFEYTLVAKIHLKEQDEGVSSLIAHACVSHLTPIVSCSRTATILPPSRRIEPLGVKIFNKVNPLFHWTTERFRAWPPPRIRIEREAVLYLNKPLSLSLWLVDQDGESLPTAGANVRLLSAKLRVRQTRRIYIHLKRYEMQNTWIFEKKSMQAIFGEGKNDLGTLMDVAFNLPKIGPTVGTPYVKLQHTITFSARVRSGNRVYSYELHQTLKVSVPPVPEHKRPKPLELPRCVAFEVPEIVVEDTDQGAMASATGDNRQDSVGLELVQVNRKDRLEVPYFHARRFGERRIDANGVERRDWEYVEASQTA